MALTQGKNTIRRAGTRHGHSVLAGAVIHQGGIVVLKSGQAIAGRSGVGADNAAKAADAATLQVVGIALQSVTGGVADGDTKVETEAGTYFFHNKSDDLVTRSDIGKACFLVDDETVGKTSPNNTRARAGIVDDVEAGGVWVRIGAGV